MQRARITAVARARRDTIVRWFVEKKSAAKLDRPELARVRDAARRAEISKVYVYKLDRLMRSGIRDALNVLDEFRGYGCAVANCDDPFSLDAPEGPARDMMVAMFAWVAQMERALIAERISTARAQADTWGRPRALLEPRVKEIRALRARQMSIAMIAKRLRLPKSTVARAASQKGAYAPASKTRKKRSSPASSR